MTPTTFSRTIASALCAALLINGVAAPADAMMAPMNGSPSLTAERERDLSAIRATLERKAVRHRLAALGLSETEVERRLGRLSDRQLRLVAQRLDAQVPAGDDDEDLLIGLAIGVLLVALIAWLMDAMD